MSLLNKRMTLSVERDLIVLTAAVYLGAVFSTFFKALTTDLIMPLLSAIFPVNEAGKITIVLGTTTLDIGAVLVESINAIIALFLVFGVVSFLRSYAAPILGGMTGGKR
jgi:large-conductance mechanosensitive channel